MAGRRWCGGRWVVKRANARRLRAAQDCVSRINSQSLRTTWVIILTKQTLCVVVVTERRGEVGKVIARERVGGWGALKTLETVRIPIPKPSKFRRAGCAGGMRCGEDALRDQDLKQAKQTLKPVWQLGACANTKSSVQAVEERAGGCGGCWRSSREGE